MKRTLAITGSILTLLACAAPVFAASSGAPTILPDDLYIGGEMVNIDTEVAGDVLAAGGNVTVRETVQGDLMAAGGSVTVNANVMDDVRVAGGNITILRSVGDDLIVTGGNVTIQEGAVIGGDVYAYGGNLQIGGTVRGSVRAYGGSVHVGGTVDGDAELGGENVTVNGAIAGAVTMTAGEIAIGDRASFGGAVKYRDDDEKVDFKTSVTGAAPVLMDKPHKAEKAPAGAAGALLGVGLLLWLLTAALMIFLLMLVPGNLFRKAAHKVSAAPWMSLLIGFLYVVVTPILLVILAITLIGLPLALIGFAVYAFTMYLSGVLTAMIAARWVEQYTGARWSKAGFFFASLGLLFVFKVLWVIPVVGWILCFVLRLMGIGSLMMAKLDLWKMLSVHLKTHA